MNPRSVSPVAKDVRAAVVAAVTEESGGPGDPALSGVPDVGEFLRHAERHGVTCTLARSPIALPDELCVALAARAELLGFRAMVLAKELGRALELLASEGIRVLAVKGLALAAQTTGDFRARGAGDIDLLVPDADVERAVVALARGGWHPRQPDYPNDVATWAWRHMRRTTFEVVLLGDRSSIDLHWRLDPARGTLPDFDELWGRRVDVEVGGQLIATLGLEDAWRHSLRHAARDRWNSLQSLVDCQRLERQIVERPPLVAPESQTLAVCAHLFDGAGSNRVTRAAERHLDVVNPRVLIVGTTLMRNARDRLRGGIDETPRTVLAAVLPYHAAAGIPDRRGITGFPRALWGYLRTIFRRGWLIG